MNEEVKQINSEIKEYQSKIKELEEKKQVILSSDLKIGRFIKVITPDFKSYICVSNIKYYEDKFLNVMIFGLIIHKSFGGGYYVTSDDAISICRNDITEITKEEFEEVLDKAINNFKSIIQ